MSTINHEAYTLPDMSHQANYLRQPIPELSFRVKASAEAAAKLTRIGQRVLVTRDDNTTLETVVRVLPWQLGHGAWVVSVEGLSGGYCCNRVTPL